MTTTYLSFAEIAKLHNSKAVSPIGELSVRARTFEVDPDVFSLDASTEVVLYNFAAIKDNTPTTLPKDLATRQLNIADWLYQQALNGNLTQSRADCMALLKATFTSGIEFTAVGDMVTNGSIWLPSVVKGNHLVTASGSTQTDSQSFVLWFADAYFQDQYPTATYMIVHPVPITEIDSLYTMNFQQLQARLDLETPDVIAEREHEIADNSPYTLRSVSGFNVYDLINVPSFVKAYWRILTRGNYVEDSVLEQIRKEILANSKYTEEQWGEKIPDLFNPNEFYGIIRFDRLGLLNKTNNTSTLSPIVDHETEFKFVDVYLTPNMSTDHVIKSTQSIPSLYKSLQYSMTAKVNNRDGFQKMSDILTDYQLIDSKDPDFGLISADTRKYLLEIENLLAAAEVVTEFSLPPQGITTVRRFGKLWVTKKVNQIKYMLLTRYQMVQDKQIDK